MADKAWKQFERECAKLVGGSRFWANSGESLDFEGPVFSGQSKHVGKMSLNMVCELAENAEYDGKKRTKKKWQYSNPKDLSDATLIDVPDPRIGIVMLKNKPGRGKKATTIVVMTGNVFHELFPTGGGIK